MITAHNSERSVGMSLSLVGRGSNAQANSACTTGIGKLQKNADSDCPVSSILPNISEVVVTRGLNSGGWSTKPQPPRFVSMRPGSRARSLTAFLCANRCECFATGNTWDSWPTGLWAISVLPGRDNFAFDSSGYGHREMISWSNHPLVLPIC
jgi:hypothetical protein